MRNYEVSFRVYDPNLTPEILMLAGYKMKTKHVRIAAGNHKSAELHARARLPHCQFNALCSGTREL